VKKEEALSDSNINVIIVRHSLLNQIPLILLIILLVALSIYGTFKFPMTLQTLFTVGGFTIYLPLFGIFPLVVCGVLAHRVLNERLIFHPDYMLFREGVVSWRENSSRVEYEWIREVNIKQNLLNKLLGVGEVKVSTVATQIAAVLTMPGVRNPRAVKDEIYRTIEAAKSAKDDE